MMQTKSKKTSSVYFEEIEKLKRKYNKPYDELELYKLRFEVWMNLCVGLLNGINETNPQLLHGIVSALKKHGLYGSLKLTKLVRISADFIHDPRSIRKNAQKFCETPNFPTKNTESLSYQKYREFLKAHFFTNQTILRFFQNSMTKENKIKSIQQAFQNEYKDYVPMEKFFIIFKEKDFIKNVEIESEIDDGIEVIDYYFMLKKDFFNDLRRKLSIWFKNDSLTKSKIGEKICAYLCGIAEGDSFRKHLSFAKKHFPNEAIVEQASGMPLDFWIGNGK